MNTGGDGQQWHLKKARRECVLVGKLSLNLCCMYSVLCGPFSLMKPFKTCTCILVKLKLYQIAFLSCVHNFTHMIWSLILSPWTSQRNTGLRRGSLGRNQSLLPRLVFLLIISDLLQYSFCHSPKPPDTWELCFLYMFLK